MRLSARLFLPLTALLVSGVATAASETSLLSVLPENYATDRLAAIAGAVRVSDNLPENTISSRDTVIFFNYDGYPARADIRNGKVSHLGYRIFPDTTRTTATLPVFDFLERQALEESLGFESISEADADKIRYKNLRKSDLRDMFARALPVGVRTEDYIRYQVEWVSPQGETMRVIVPVSYELLLGAPMVENERRLKERLLSPAENAVQPGSRITADLLTPTVKTNCFIIRGNSIFSDYLTSDRYYESVPDSIAPAFRILDNTSYPVETISNMLSGLDIPNDIEIDLTMITYPMEKITMTLPLSRMTACFIEDGCEIFTGLSGLTDSEAQFVMICRNAPCGYCHSLRLKVPLAAVGEKRGKATGRLTPYIPLSRILNLFSEQ